MKPLRIVHTVSSLLMGGMEQFVLRIAHAQQLQGHQVTVLALRGGPLEAEAQRLKIPVRVLSSNNKFTRVFHGARVIRGLRPDIVNAHNPTSLHYAVLAKWGSQARVVLVFHGEGKKNGRVPGAYEWRNTDAIVAVSHAAIQQLRVPSFASKIEVIHNGVDFAPATRTREAVRAELNLSENLVGIMVARMDGLKGHDTLIKALGKVKDAFLLTMLIAGDGAERSAMEKLATEQGLTTQNIRFLGFRTDIPDLLSASDFFVLPSLTEGLPLSVMEAMTHGLPIIATPVGGIPELVTHGETGLLIPVNDFAALAEAVSTLAADRSMRSCLGEAGHHRIRADFTFEKMTRNYEELYHRLRG